MKTKRYLKDKTEMFKDLIAEKKRNQPINSNVQPSNYVVIFHADENTSTDLGVHLLVSHFGIEEKNAKRMMEYIKENGAGGVSSLPRDIAETKVYVCNEEMKKIASGWKQRLKITMERIDD